VINTLILEDEKFGEEKTLRSGIDDYRKISMKKSFTRGRTRTCNPLIRSQMRYPLRHTGA
jgi:hypothetical protein